MKNKLIIMSFLALLHGGLRLLFLLLAIVLDGAVFSLISSLVLLVLLLQLLMSLLIC
jgi:hypothetical protein